jgi:hypothetical protein
MGPSTIFTSWPRGVTSSSVAHAGASPSCNTGRTGSLSASGRSWNALAPSGKTVLSGDCGSAQCTMLNDVATQSVVAPASAVPVGSPGPQNRRTRMSDSVPNPGSTAPGPERRPGRSQCQGSPTQPSCSADLDGELLTALSRRFQGLARQAPCLRRLLAWPDESVLDPLDTRGLASGCGTAQAISHRCYRGAGSGVFGQDARLQPRWDLEDVIVNFRLGRCGRATVRSVCRGFSKMHGGFSGSPLRAGGGRR